MGLVKFSVAQTLSVERDGKEKILRRIAHRHHFDYVPREGFIYVRSRAISSRVNDNYDAFPAEEIKKAYRTFIGKPVFVNHNNIDHRRARGVVIDAALHEDIAPDGRLDTWVEVLHEIDAVNFPKLAKAILAGHIDRTSMGTDVAFSKCSFCGNKATTPLEYCQHIPRMKGKRVFRTTANGTKEGVLIFEECFGLKFFEDSVLVEPPADPTAYFLGVEEGPKIASMIAQASARSQVYSQLYEADMAKLSYGETIAPPDVNTLRDEECPVCQEKDSYDGNECQVCGFVQPPKMFRDPDLDKAKQIDIRKDVLEDDPKDGDPQATDAQGMPEEIPGSQSAGSDQVPLDPTNLDENGQTVSPQMGPDGKPIPPDQMQQGQPVGPDGMPLGPDGMPMDPQQMDQQQQQPMDPKMLDQNGMPLDPALMTDPNMTQDPAALQDDPALADPKQQMPVPQSGAQDLPPGAPDQGQTDKMGPDGQPIDGKPMLEPDELDQDGHSFSPAGGQQPPEPVEDQEPGQEPEPGEEQEQVLGQPSGPPGQPQQMSGPDPQKIMDDGEDPTEVMGRPLNPGEISDIYGQPLGPDGPLDEEERAEHGVTGPQDQGGFSSDTGLSPGDTETEEEMQPPGAGGDATSGGASGPQFAPDGQKYDTAQEGDQTAQLECPACHSQFTAAPPTSVTTDNPQGTSEGTVEGDICPSCGRALLITVQDGDPDLDEDDNLPSVGAEATGDKLDNNRETTPFGKNKLSWLQAVRMQYLAANTLPGHLQTFEDRNNTATHAGRYSMQQMTNGLVNVHDNKSGLMATYDAGGKHLHGPKLH